MISSCKHCGATLFDGNKTVLGETHVCPPRWLVWDPEYCDREDSAYVYAYDSESAAQQWAEDTAPDRDYDTGEITLCVASADEPPEYGHDEVTVYGETEITWYANRKPCAREV